MKLSMKQGMFTAFAAVLAIASVPVAGVSAATNTDSQREVLGEYGVNQKQWGQIVVDSAMSREQALGDNVVPMESRDLHQKMKPYLRVVPVVYRGFEEKPKIHIGQIVVHKDLVRDTHKLFARMFAMGFPIKSVIPAAKFAYNDEASMAANNTSNYRPEEGSEHLKGAAFDINPFTNPFDVTRDDGTRTIQPAGASYNPNAKGALTRDGDVRKLWTSLHYEWGGNWGDPNADPPTDFYKVGYFDYQHFQLDYTRYQSLPLPAGI